MKKPTMNLAHRKDLFPHYRSTLNVGLTYLPEYIATGAGCGDPSMVDIDPDYQRGHVWSMAQKRAYMEYLLRGGEAARALTFACDAHGANRNQWRLLDGKQRLSSALDFMADKIGVFVDKDHPEGHVASGISGIRGHLVNFEIRVIAVDSRLDELTIYLNMNSGGTPHSQEELSRVAAMIELERNSKGA